eukprot:CCRYP_011229-RA/>CCRYP_011229-RA protein AED:0.34 eAED:0.17 QI:0/0/0/0.66/0/0/3/0/294
MLANEEDQPVNRKESMNFLFANYSVEIAMNPLTAGEIADKTDNYTSESIENTKVLCKDDKLVIPKELQYRTVELYHHYLQHPGITRLEETILAAMYWIGMHRTVRAYIKRCQKCQVNKRHKHKYSKLPTKLVITNPWEALCGDLIGPYTLKKSGRTIIDFMCLAMIDPATSWFEIVELPTEELQEHSVPMSTKGRTGKETHDKTPTTSAAIFGHDMLFNIPLLADWNKIGDYRQRQTNHNTACENRFKVDWNYKVGDQVLLQKEGILCKGKSLFHKEPWTISDVQTNGTIKIQC